MAAYSLQRGKVRESRSLRATLFDVDHAEREAERQLELAAKIERLEAKLRAIEEHPAIDDAALRAATMHTRLVCTPRGYALVEVDAPPPTPGVRIEHDGASYTVLRLGGSLLPGDTRRCAVLVQS